MKGVPHSEQPLSPITVLVSTRTELVRNHRRATPPHATNTSSSLYIIKKNRIWSDCPSGVSAMLHCGSPTPFPSDKVLWSHNSNFISTLASTVSKVVLIEQATGVVVGSRFFILLRRNRANNTGVWVLDCSHVGSHISRRNHQSGQAIAPFTINYRLRIHQARIQYSRYHSGVLEKTPIKTEIWTRA